MFKHFKSRYFVVSRFCSKYSLKSGFWKFALFWTGGRVLLCKTYESKNMKNMTKNRKIKNRYIAIYMPIYILSKIDIYGFNKIGLNRLKKLGKLITTKNKKIKKIKIRNCFFMVVYCGLFILSNSFPISD